MTSEVILSCLSFTGSLAILIAISYVCIKTVEWVRKVDLKLWELNRRVERLEHNEKVRLSGGLYHPKPETTSATGETLWKEEE